METTTATATKNEAPASAGANPVAERPAPKPPLVGGGKINAIIPQDIESVFRLANVIVAAKMNPKSLDSVEKCTVAIMHGLEVGFTPMAALQSIAVVNGMPSIWGDGLIALVRASGLLEDIQETVDDDQEGPTIAVCKVKRKDSPSWVVQSFTRPQAMKAGLWRKQGPWVQYPHRMMQMRARAFALRDAFPDVLRGLHSAEEAADMVDITATGSATTAPPEPRRSDFKFTANGHDGRAPATDIEVEAPPHDPQTGETHSAEPKSWKIADTVVGQQARLAAIHDLLEMAENKSDVDDIEKEHREFLDKLGRLKPETMKAFADRKAELPEASIGAGK